jgi:hypothetical protein
MSTQLESTGFLASLFDFSFAHFITARLIRVLYGLGLILAGLAVLGLLVSGFGQGVGYGLVTLIIAPFAFLLIAMYFRVLLEVLIVVFRIAENVEKIADREQGAAP